MENVVWGEVPAQRTRKQEQFTYPVVTMSAIDKPGAGRKFSFNKAAQTALGIQGEDRVSFGFETNGKRIFIKKAEGEAGFQLTKTCTLSDKKTYEFIAKRWDLNSEVENHLELTMNEAYGELTLLTAVEVAESVSFEPQAVETVEDEVVVPEVHVEEEIEEQVDASPNDEFSTEADGEDVW